MLSPDSALGATDVPLGLVPGWSLALEGGDPWSVSSSAYDATLEITADATLASATWTVVLDGLTDSDHARLRRAGPDEVLVISLGWADAPGAPGLHSVPVLGALATMAGAGPTYPVVVRGAVDAVTRGNGTYRYPTTVTGTDADVRALRTTLVGTDPLTGSSLHDRAGELARRAGLDHVSHGRDVPVTRAEEMGSTSSVLDALAALLDRAHGEGADRTVPAFVQGGSLHVGPASGRAGRSPHRLDRSTGLASATVEGDVRRVTTVGRTDIALGDLCELDEAELAEPDVSTTVATAGWVADVVGGIADALGGGGSAPGGALVVVGLRHRLNPTDGFVTELALVDAPAPDQRTVPSTAAHGWSSDPARRVASRLTTTTGPALGVGMVAAQTVAAGSDARAQRVSVDEGLAPSAETVRSVRAALAESPTRLADKPYLTPFALGRTGLVLPHYPGARVLTAHVDGLPSEAVVAGALWSEGDEPESQAGDWWLSLPTGVVTTDSTDDPESVSAPSGKASHDLIDADGGRAIHLAGFTLTVGQDSMPEVGTRPSGAQQDVLTIEHDTGNARITIAADGTVTIASDKAVTVQSGDKLTLKGSSVEIVTGSTVEVKKSP